MLCPSMSPSSRRASRTQSERSDSLAEWPDGSIAYPRDFLPLLGLDYDRNSKQHHCNKDGWHRSPLHCAPGSRVIYHADRDKGKCDLHGGRRLVLAESEGQNQPEIESNPADKIHKTFSMEKSVQSQGWIEAVKKVHENGGNVFAGHLQEKYPHLYEQG